MELVFSNPGLRDGLLASLSAHSPQGQQGWEREDIALEENKASAYGVSRDSIADVTAADCPVRRFAQRPTVQRDATVGIDSPQDSPRIGARRNKVNKVVKSIRCPPQGCHVHQVHQSGLGSSALSGSPMVRLESAVYMASHSRCMGGRHAAITTNFPSHQQW